MARPVKSTVDMETKQFTLAGSVITLVSSQPLSSLHSLHENFTVPMATFG
jgi:hypothetical protein